MDNSEDTSEAGAISVRRSLRPRKISSRAIQSAYMKKFQDSVIQTSSHSEKEDDMDCDSSESIIGKPAVINSVNVLKGDRIFSFQKRAARGSLTSKVLQRLQETPKTPHHVRNKIKKKIAADHFDSSFEDFSSSNSEYEPTENSESSDSDVASEDRKEAYTSSDSSDDFQTKEHPKIPVSKVKCIATQSIRTGTRKKQPNKKYIIQTDDYFTSHSSKKILTSNHTLDKLETPRLPQDQLKIMLEKMKLTNEHEKCVASLRILSRNSFKKWLYCLQENFNILLYGLGCKRHILQEFHTQYLTDCPVVVVNGFFPTLTIKDVLDGIIVDLLELKANTANPYEACDIIEREFTSNLNNHLYLIVHNIEGQMLRSKKSQDIFAKLASIKNIHLIASIDHINAPLIWDHSKLSKLNYSWWDITSFRPYIEETSFEGSLLVQGAGTLALSSLRNVFLSLTTNSKGIYLIIVKHQLEHVKNQYYQGLAFKDLYWSSREAFLVSSDLALRAQLNEFVDHKMVKYKRSIDGTEYLIIPIANPLLQKFLDEQSK